jgi:predicted lipoprotein with Yx(FWY)xxD motif
MIKTILTLAVLIALGAVGYFWLSSMQGITPAAGAPTVTLGSTTGLPTGTTQQPQSTAPSNASPMIVPGSRDPQIVGDNQMLRIDQNSKLGNYLISYTGMTLYDYAKDFTASSTCYGDCAQVWVPYIVSGSDSISAQYGVNTAQTRVITRADGTLQVAYNGHPLYFYTGDTGPNTTNGQGVGGLWAVLKP